MAQTATVMLSSGLGGQKYGLSSSMSFSGGPKGANNNPKGPSLGMGMSEVVVKSNADVRALTYCDLKV